MAGGVVNKKGKILLPFDYDQLSVDKAYQLSCKKRQ